MAEIQVPSHLVEYFHKSEMCKTCIMEYCKLKADGKIDTDFPVACRGDIRVIPDKWGDSEDVQEVQGMRDPTIWAEYELEDPRQSGKSFKYRPYQHDIASCTARRCVLRMGRRCVVPETPVLMADGSWKQMIDIRVGEYVATRNKKNQLVKARVTLTHDNGEKDVYRIRLSNGMEITCTANHPLLAFEKISDDRRIREVWKSLDEGLNVGAKVVIAKHYSMWGSEYNPDLGALIGYMLTDGYGMKKQTPKSTNNNRRMVADVKDISGRLFGYECSIRPKGNGFDIHITDKKRGTSNLAKRLLKKIGVWGKKAKRKTLPDISDWDKPTVMHMVNRMFSGDGSAYYRSTPKREVCEFSLCSASEDMLKQVRLILLKIGAIGHIGSETRVTNRSNGKLSTLFRLRIADAASIENFYENVGPIFGKEAASLDTYNAARSKKKKRRKPGSKQFQYVTIKSIEHLGKRRTYDIGVEKHHNFIADGIVSHNTGKTLAIITKILNRMLIKKTRVMVLVPYDPANTEIFLAIDSLIASSKIMKDCVKTRTKNPHVMEFHNGSRIQGFVINSKTGTDPNKIRGQPADIIYIDEFDFIPESDFRPIRAILMDNMETELWASSTPSGLKAEFFYICCDKSRGYKEWFVPATKHPDWPRMEQMMIEEYRNDPLGWEHEVQAEFGSVEGGVYSAPKLEQSMRDYQYGDKPRRDDCIYAMGVDWNGAPIGDHGVIVEYDPQANLFTIVDKFIMNEIEYTQLKAIQVIIGKAIQWRVDLLWVDSGYGNMQIETLRKYAMERPELKLVNKIKGVQMGGTQEVRDPWTGRLKKKRIKTLVVNLTAEKIATGCCIFPSFEDQKDGLVDQLRGLTIKRFSQNGDPVYDNSYDHTMTAWQVAIYGIMIKYSDINRTTLSETVVFMPNIMRNGHEIMALNDTGSIKIEPKMLRVMREDLNRLKQSGRSGFRSSRHGHSPGITRQRGSIGKASHGDEEKRETMTTPLRRVSREYEFGRTKKRTGGRGGRGGFSRR